MNSLHSRAQNGKRREILAAFSFQSTRIRTVIRMVTSCEGIVSTEPRVNGFTSRLFLYRDSDGSGETRYAPRFLILSLEAQGECLPRFENFVELDPEKKDAWGIPALRIHASFGENEHAMAKAMRQDIGNMLDACGVKDAEPPREELSVFGKNIHECGTARMGTDPKKSVLNAFNQVHDVKNVFVTDGAAFVTQGCYEPTLTIMAISVRASDYIVEAYKKREL